MSSTAIPIASAPDTVTAKAARLIDALSKGQFEIAERAFDATMREALPAPKLEAAWQAVEKGAGSFEAVEKVEVMPKGDFEIALATSRFARSRIMVRVVYDAEGKVAGLFFQPPAVAWNAPAYADPSRFEEREVEVGSAPALPATLTLPGGAGPFPGVVLVHGSGPNDRDETIGGTKPFKDLAWGLATRGIAVLRYEKRSRHAPAGIVTQKEEVLDAAGEAVALLAKMPEIDRGRIFVLGHSQGGYLAPRIGLANPSLAGIIVLAGSTRPLEESMIEQLEYLGSIDPAKVEALRPTLEAARQLKSKVNAPGLRPDDKVDLPTGGAVTGAYFLDVRGYQPHEESKKLTVPLLVLQGERDYQVTMRDFEGWRSALDGKPDATLRTYARLNHLFVRGEGTPSPAEYAKPGHIDDEVIGDVATWIEATRANHAVR